MSLATYGWRARIGLILPADNILMEPELYALGIPGLSFHALRLTSTDHDAMRHQAGELAGAIRELGLDIVVYACSETSFNAGTGARLALSELIEKECGIPVVTATSALLAAISALGLTKVSVVTPYKEKSGREFVQTLKDAGVSVLSSVHRDFRETSNDSREWYATNREAATTVYQMARSVDVPEGEAIVIASTNLSTLSIRSQLERDRRKPVLSSNQSILWWCLQSLDIEQSAFDLGELAEKQIPSTKGASSLASDRTPASLLS